MTSLGNSGKLLTTKLHTLFHLLVLPLTRKDIAALPNTSLDLITWTIYYYYYIHTCHYDIMVGWLVGSCVKAKRGFASAKRWTVAPWVPQTT